MEKSTTPTGPGAAAVPSCQQSYPQRWTINGLLAALCDELAEGDVPYPLEQPCRLGLVWLDLCRLAGEEPPADVVALVDQPACVAIEARGGAPWSS